MIIQCRKCGKSRTAHDTSSFRIMGLCGRCAKEGRERLIFLSQRCPMIFEGLIIAGLLNRSELRSRGGTGRR